MDLRAQETGDGGVCLLENGPSLPEGRGMGFDLPIQALTQPIFTEKLLCAEHCARCPGSYKMDKMHFML